MIPPGEREFVRRVVVSFLLALAASAARAQPELSPPGCTEDAHRDGQGAEVLRLGIPENRLRRWSATEASGPQESAGGRAAEGSSRPDASRLDCATRRSPEDAAGGPWWEQQLHGQMWPGSNTIPVDLSTLILRALSYSAQIRVLSDAPLIQRTAIVEADAAFDWRSFIETRWDGISEPVGSVLTAGPDAVRFRDGIWKYEGGVRRKNRLGGQLEISQRLGHENSNSIFFVPQDQGTARLSISYTHPLLRGSGKVYNTSLVVLAELDAEIAHDQLLQGLQTHLLEIARAYWNLYLYRGALLQKQRLHARAREILEELEGRAGLDTAASQLVRVRAAVAEREADLVRAETAVRNAEERIRALVNDPALAAVPLVEMVPQDVPDGARVPIDMAQAVAVAYRQRPEIDQALRQVKAASVRLDMSKHEMLPQLDLVLETYASGLRGESDIPRAVADQFSVGEPSYAAGLTWELPFGNRAARARHQRRLLEARQLQNQFRATVEMLMLEVKVAVREVDTAYREMLAKGRSMQAAQRHLDYVQQRWQHLAGDRRSGDLHLEDLLEAQVQLASAEFQYLQAATAYSLAVIELKRATGTLLQDERITHTVVQAEALPAAVLGQAAGAPRPHAVSGPAEPRGEQPERTEEQPERTEEQPKPPIRVLWEPDGLSAEGATPADDASPEGVPSGHRVVWPNGEPADVEPVDVDETHSPQGQPASPPRAALRRDSRFAPQRARRLPVCR